MPTRDGEISELTVAEADTLVPGLARFVSDGGAPPAASFVPSSQRRDEGRSNAGWGAVVLTALGAALVPVSIANASTNGAAWYLVIAIWVVGVAIAVRKWILLRSRRDEPPRDGLFILTATLLVVTGTKVQHVPAPAIVDLAVHAGRKPDTATVRVCGAPRRSGSPWTDLGVFDADAVELGERLRAWRATAAA